MVFFKRIFLFLAVNILVVTTISILLNVLGIRPYLTAQGIDYSSLMAFCLVWGMGGAFISLALSRFMAKMLMGVRVIDPSRASGVERDLVQTVHHLARTAGLTTMPEVGIYDSPELNAFATGPTKSRALVAVSSGLLTRMSPAQVEGVLGHEIAHVANGDMVTLALIQGVVNAFVMFLARVIAFAISQNAKEENRRMIQFATTFVLEITLSLFGAMVVAYFSRIREYRADQGGARFAGREKMISALRGLLDSKNMVDDSNASLNAFKISTGGKVISLFSTHPPLEDRIRRLSTGA